MNISDKTADETILWEIIADVKSTLQAAEFFSAQAAIISHITETRP